MPRRLARVYLFETLRWQQGGCYPDQIRQFRLGATMKRMIQILAASTILLNISACSSSDEATAYDEEGYVVDESGYDGGAAYGDSSDLYGSDLTFHGYEWTEDCSGHEAGYAWAEENYITDPDNCGGNSQSFIEGCIAYAEENGGVF